MFTNSSTRPTTPPPSSSPSQSARDKGEKKMNIMKNGWLRQSVPWVRNRMKCKGPALAQISLPALGMRPPFFRLPSVIPSSSYPDIARPPACLPAYLLTTKETPPQSSFTELTMSSPPRLVPGLNLSRHANSSCSSRHSTPLHGQ